MLMRIYTFVTMCIIIYSTEFLVHEKVTWKELSFTTTNSPETSFHRNEV